jgi:hypothetical protein
MQVDPQWLAAHWQTTGRKGTPWVGRVRQPKDGFARIKPVAVRVLETLQRQP